MNDKLETYQKNSEAMAMSLDEYVRKKKMTDQFALLNHRKRDQNISQDFLDKSLDAYIQQNPKNHSIPPKTSRCGKFDRKSLRDDSDDDSEEETQIAEKSTMLDSDVEMKDTSETDIQLAEAEEDGEEGDDLDDILHFRTVESKNGYRVRSQQWRMLPENLLDRPEGAKRLEFLPLDENERYKQKGVQNGGIRKNYRSRASSFASLEMKPSNLEQISASGTFVEKGSFTYKFGDRNRDGLKDGIIGIERAKLIVPPVQAQRGSQSAPPVNINMNWDGFFHGFNQCVDKIKQPTPPPAASIAGDSKEVGAAALQLLSLLMAKNRESDQSKYNIEIQNEIANIQMRPLVVEDRGAGKNVMTSAGNGIDNFLAPSHSTQKPLNFRFA